MSLANTDEERQMAEVATRLFADHAPPSRLRRYRDEHDAHAYDRGLWAKLVELGFLDSALSLAERCVLAETAGSVLATEPLGVSWFAMDLMGPGERLVTVAHEPMSRRPAVVSSLDHLVRRNVAHAVSADVTLFTQMKGDEVSLFEVAAGHEALKVEAQQRVDLHPAAIVSVDSTRLPPPVSLPAKAYDRALDRATVVLCAEMLGGAQRAFELTLDYLKTRRQFGVLIGSFQALQHRAARLFVELALTRSAVSAAARADDNTLAVLTSVAKARCGETFLRVAEEAIQLHGGIGMTDEHDIGLYLKRAMVTEHLLGNGDEHRRRFARLSGF